ncbi:glycosyltransferase [Flavobacterium aciduliphilum]|uniref:Glycosyltransferase involved in cell wall biosynthesis n=1 Tax=Flavobacterium aciduliphilum TaxID=1101402 RepID=A0A328YMH0_9FLAO|nr:glycosyltransferase [Flavobacterium aciduliphilum]RAR75328.1 glycosyltransferase involved in cell wall biosynthesis [Flavobacterium aciduliphilum]
MRILLIGEFSRLHNSLKEGLQALGHEVTLIAHGDGFKNYPCDLSTRAQWCESKVGNVFRQFIYRFTKIDVAQHERGIRFWWHSSQLKGYDVVQLINEASIQTVPFFEQKLLKKIVRQNSKTFLLCCGVDYSVAQHLIQKKERYSIMNPYFENPKAAKEYRFIFDFLTPSHKKIHDLVYQNIQGVIASDIDYVLPMQNHPKFLGLIPNPVNISKINYADLEIKDKIIVFLGINRNTYFTKGICFFEEALKIIKGKYPDKVDVIITESIPYKEYITLYDNAHIVLDQVYGFDQGYNALEAMAKGKVVFTGAEIEFEKHYNLTEKVAVNALPDMTYLVTELSYLIENPKEIIKIGIRARAFVEKEHDYIQIAKKYLKAWNGL